MFIKNFLKRVYFYLRYPRQFYPYVYSLFKQGSADKLGIQKIAPNYILFEIFTEKSVVIDVGCGFNPELSQYLIKKFGLTAFAVDPTKKHAAALGELANRYSPRFIHLPYAVTNEDKIIEFFETIDFESGSTLMDHCYVSKGRLRKYEVQSRNISSLVKELKLQSVDLMKLDLEGAEYELIANMKQEDLNSIKQLFIEFHHHAFKRIKRKDTRKAVAIIKSFGFKAFTLDSNNYLFYRM